MKLISYLLILLAVFSVVVLGCQKNATTHVDKASATSMSEKQKCEALEKLEKSGLTQWTEDEKQLIEKCEAMEKKSMEGKESMMAEEGYEMINGKMMMVNEKTKIHLNMEMDAILNDGTKVMTNGKIIRTNGTIFTLKEGESIWMDDSFMKAGEMMESNEKESMMSSSAYTGKVLAGTGTTKYLEFNKADYGKALKDKKKILLYFFANWCPTCKAEQPETFAAFNDLNNPDVIGFRVNYRDSDTDADEESLAKEFGVSYQHTKIILKDGQKIGKWPDSWDKKRYLEELAKV